MECILLKDCVGIKKGEKMNIAKDKLMHMAKQGYIAHPDEKTQAEIKADAEKKAKAEKAAKEKAKK